MKTQNLFIAFLILAFIFSSCEKEPVNIDKPDSVLPEKFSVDIPSALSQGDLKKSLVAVDTLNGNVIYANLVTFIKIGEGSAEIVEGIIKSIRKFKIDKALSLTYISDEDGRTKNLVVKENVYFEGKTWEFELLITDADSEGEADGGKALQIFWDRKPVDGLSIVKPYNLNRSDRELSSESVFRIDYSENGERGYDAHMIISASGLPLAHPLVNPFSVNSLKMFVGKKDNVVDVYGNTNHPNATFFTPSEGFSWSFVASGDHNLNIGVAEVGLPPSNLDENSRTVLLEDYSVKNVFSSEIYELWPYIDTTTVNAYLYNTQAPGFFNKYGFIRGGESPGEEYDHLLGRLPSLSPYNPKSISELDIQFGE